MTTIVKHVARKPLAVSNATKTQISGRNKQLRERFPTRQPEHCGTHTTGTAEDTLVRLTSGLFTSDVKSTQAGRRRGVTKLLEWLATFQGDTWQQRWESSSVEKHPGKTWTGLPLTWLRERDQNASSDANDLTSGMLMLICGDVIRPGLRCLPARTPVSPLRWRTPETRTDSLSCSDTQKPNQPAPPPTRKSRPPGSRTSSDARADALPTSPSATVSNWSTPWAKFTLEADKRRWTSTYACARSASSLTTRRTRSAP